ncbi:MULTISPECIES: type A2 lantipeptide [unclassified Streptomyces]|uniref:type A2 lantipeptide n=1 Tax=unclassified Streptomyces TaxID=2593676 RepID=UPI0033A561CC
MNPEIQTLEISDADLDNVSGGLHSAVASSAVANVTATVDSIAPVSGVATSAVGAVESFAGLNSSALTGFAAGL